MGIFDRLSTLIRSNINDLISRAEDPEKMLNQLIVDMRSQLAKAKQQVASAIADEKRLSAQVEQERKLAEDWEKRAVLAVQEGRDDLAKQALLRHNEHAHGAVQLHETWVKHREETDKLKGSLRQLNDKIEEAKRKKNILIARQKRAEAHKRIQETMSSIGDKSAFETFDRLAEAIEHEERKLIAAAEVTEDLSGDTLIKQFAAFEEKADADQQLLADEVVPPQGAARIAQLGKGAAEAELVDDDGGDRPLAGPRQSPRCTAPLSDLGGFDPSRPAATLLMRADVCARSPAGGADGRRCWATAARSPSWVT
jgi:phage shock protein A